MRLTIVVRRSGLLTTGLGNQRKSGIRSGTMVKHFQFHITGLKIPNTNRPNAISHPASATPRNERKKKGLTIKRKSHESISEIPSNADSNWDRGSQRSPHTASANIAERNVKATTVSNMMKTQRHTVVPTEMGVLMVLNDKAHR